MCFNQSHSPLSPDVCKDYNDVFPDDLVECVHESLINFDDTKSLDGDRISPWMLKHTCAMSDNIIYILTLLLNLNFISFILGLTSIIYSLIIILFAFTK